MADKPFIMLLGSDLNPASLKGEIEGLYGRLPPDLMKLVRKIADAPNYDFGAMELLDALDIEWRGP